MELNFLDTATLDPLEQAKVHQILYGHSEKRVGKVEFPWGDEEIRNIGGDEARNQAMSFPQGIVPPTHIPVQNVGSPDIPQGSLPPQDSYSFQHNEQVVVDMGYSSGMNYNQQPSNSFFYDSTIRERDLQEKTRNEKPYERRNKKRRPPDYYKKIEEEIKAEMQAKRENVEEARPVAWHEEVEQSEFQSHYYSKDVGIPMGKFSAPGQFQQEHQNFSANFVGNNYSSQQTVVTEHEKFIPVNQECMNTYTETSGSHNPMVWQQQPHLHNQSQNSVLPHPVSLNAMNTIENRTNVESVPQQISYMSVLSEQVSGEYLHVQQPELPIQKRAEISIQSHQSPSILSDSSRHISSPISAVPETDSVDKIIDEMGSLGSMSLHQSEQSELDPDQYPALGKTSNSKDQYPALGKVTNNSENVQTISENLPVSSASDSNPISVPVQTQKPKSASWAGLFSNVDPAKQGFVVQNWTPVPTKESKPVEPTPPKEGPCTVPIAEDPLARSFGDLLSRMKVSHAPVGLQPRGLINKGNWCYINATLQALISCPPFYNVMKKFPVHAPARKGKSSTPILDSIVQFVHEFTPCGRPTERGKRTINDLPQGSSFEPNNVYKMLQVMEANQSFKLGRQEDAEEFLSCILDGMHEEMSSLMKLVKPCSTEAAPNGYVADDSVSIEDSSDNADPDSWEQVGPRKKSVRTRKAFLERTPLADIFVGYTRSALYKAASKDSATLQPFFTLQLDIQSENVHSVKEALEGLVSREAVSGFTCSKTKAEVDVVRHLTLEELPPVLILHLKFFVYDKDGGSQKLLKNLEYTIDLEITKDLLSPNVKNKLQMHQRSYKLFAVVYHHGKKATGGHYTTAVFHPAINNWIMIDDSNVKHVNVATVLKNIQGRVPYLLYYRRIDMH